MKKIQLGDSYRNICGIVVQKNGEKVYETYQNGYSENDTVHIFSVTKSIISLLLGIAIDQGNIRSVSEKVLDFFPDYKVEEDEDTVQNVTIKDMLTMTAPYKSKMDDYPNYFMSADWGLNLTAVDMAKIGQLYLNCGAYETKQIVSEQWIRESTKIHSCSEELGLSYGYLWWILDGEKPVYAAVGDGGNVIYVNQEKNIVVSIAALLVPDAGDSIELIKNVLEPAV